MNDFNQTTDADIKELEMEIQAKQDQLNNLKYADYEAAKEEYALAQHNYQEAYKQVIHAKNKYLNEMNKKVRDKSATYFFGGRAF